MGKQMIERMPSAWIVPDWVREALQALRPPAKMTISQWADTMRVLDSKTSALPGPWRTSYTPYLRDVMDAFTDPEVEEIIFVKPTQVGGTEAILNMIGYIIAQDPSPALVVYPTDALGEWTSENRIQLMIRLCPSLQEKFIEGSKRLELQFEDMYLAISGANSPSGLAGRPCRFVFLDEVDKYPQNAGKEASPRSLAKERTKTYDSNKKIVEVSTPTLESGPIWQDYLAADSQYECFVVCPHCGAEWIFQMGNLKFDTASPDAARASAVYVCPDCGCAIGDSQKNEMVRHCHWKAVKQGSRRRIGFHLNTFYSPWVRLGDIAYEFVASKDSPDLLQNFINSWLGEPFKQVEGQTTAERLFETRQGGYPREQVPSGTVMLTGGVDVQRRGYYWTIKAWQPNMTNYTIHHGYAFSWLEVEYAMNQVYRDKTGQEYIVNLCCVDSGDQTDDVYDFCARNREWAIPIKGASARMQNKYSLTTINKDGLAKGMQLCVVDTGYYKDVLFGRFLRDADNGGWFIYNDPEPEYLEMMTSEQKVIERVRGRLLALWKPKVSGGANHYWDCEVYAACAADLCGLRTVAAETARAEREEIDSQPRILEQVQPPIPPMQSSGGYFRRRERRWRR